jgi:leucyl aminopeptidase (aminopeptidase T)
MTTGRLLAALVLLAAVLWPLAPAADEPARGGLRDADALAQKLVAQCARVQDGDIVQIMGGARDAELLESLAVQVAKVGGDPLIVLAPGDRTMRRLYTDVPARFDARTPPLGLKLADQITVQIGVDPMESEAALADIPAERVTARQKARLPIVERLLKRNVRQVYLGNGLYPTAERAKQLGITKEELAQLFWGGLNVDYARLQATGEALARELANGRRLSITHPNGTDLTVDIARRPAFVSDGVLSDDKLRKGGPACQAWLPAGEVYIATVPGTAAGKVVIERQFWEGKEVKDLTLTFRAGKLTAMTAQSGLERIQALYDAAGPGKEELSSVDIGINPNVRLPQSSRLGVYMQAGMITIGIGNNTWAGGENRSAFALPGFLPGGTLKVDDKVLVELGVLMQ